MANDDREKASTRTRPDEKQFGKGSIMRMARTCT